MGASPSEAICTIPRDSPVNMPIVSTFFGMVICMFYQGTRTGTLSRRLPATTREVQFCRRALGGKSHVRDRGA
jgi:hypothetical protein